MSPADNVGDISVYEVVFMFQILIVEDDIALNNTVRAYLEKKGYGAFSAYSAAEAYDILEKQAIDLIISDVMMPEVDGIEFARAIRRSNESIPILFMTARDDFPTKQLGYAAGIDDYMVKPVDLDELTLHIHALLRRAGVQKAKELTIGNLTMKVDETAITVNGKPVPVTVREFKILFKLLSNPGKTFTRAQLMDEFWNPDAASSTRTVDVYMVRLRNKLADCDGFKIATVYGLGYKAVLL